MRPGFIVLFLLFVFPGYTQVTLPTFKTYAGKKDFVDTLCQRMDKLPPEKRIDSLVQLADRVEKQGDRELELELRLQAVRVRLNRETVQYAETEKKIASLLATATTLQLDYVRADALHLMGLYYAKFNQQSTAIDYFISAYNIYKRFSGTEFPSKQEYTYMIGGIFYRYEDYENAIKYLQEAWRSNKAANTNLYCSIFNTIGLSYRNMHQYDSAIHYFQKTHEVAVSLGNEPYTGITMGNIGITYYLQGKYDEAIPLLKTDIETSIATHQFRNAVGSMATLATIYNYKKNYDEAENLLNDALNLGNNSAFWSNFQIAENIFVQLSIVYAARGNYHLAYLYADSARIARDSLSAIHSSVELARALDKIEYTEQKLASEKLRNQVKIDQLEIGKKRIETSFFFAGIAVLLAVILFITRERRRSDALLLNILPAKIAERLKREEHPIADYFEQASVLFIDMADFTEYSNGRDPKKVVNLLNDLFTRFDAIAEKYGMEKIKTIGDCYTAVSGIPEPNPAHAEAAARMALEVRTEMNNYMTKDGARIAFRLGLDCGPVVAGVIGRRKFIYDLWGDTVNMASRMETMGVVGEIQCTDRFKNTLKGPYAFESRGITEIKGKGMMETWLLRPEHLSQAAKQAS